MDISTLSGTTSGTASAGTTTLQSQLQSKQMELQRVEASKLDEKTKAARIRDLKAEIEALQAQIQQKSQAKTKKTATPEAKASTGSVDALV
jgi:capsule polysaccharide export protein KpsE/RkpR